MSEEAMPQTQAAIEDRQIAYLETKIAETQRDDADLNRKTLSDAGDRMSDEMERIYDRVQKSSEQEAKRNPEMPTVHGARNIHDIMEVAADWHEKGLPERRRDAAAHQELEARRKEAERYGLDIQQYEAIKTGEAVGNIQSQTKAPPQPQAGQYSLPPTFNDGIAATRALYPNDDPGQVLANYASIDRALRTNGPAALQWIAQQYGIGAQPQPSAPPVEAVEGVQEFLRQHPEADADEMLRVINSGEIEKIPGDLNGTLNRALSRIRARAPHLFDEKAKRARDKAAPASLRRADLESEMEAVYERAAAR